MTRKPPKRLLGSVRNFVCKVMLQSAGAEDDQATEEIGTTDGGFDPAALDQLLGERRTMGELGELFRQMKKAPMERALAGELTHHLGYAPGDPKPEAQPNHRDGTMCISR